MITYTMSWVAWEPSAASKSNVLGWLMKRRNVFGPWSFGALIFSEWILTVWLKAKLIISCSSQSDSRYPGLLDRQASRGWSSASFRHSQPALVTKVARSNYKHILLMDLKCDDIVFIYYISLDTSILFTIIRPIVLLNFLFQGIWISTFQTINFGL